MSTNLSQQKRERLLKNIKIMREKLKDNPELITSLADMESELKRKKYGLVWEEHEERVDEELKTKIPVFKEDKQLEIKLDENKPINFLIEGDNLHSLYLLEKTHKEKVDVVYIDPPYNTGNKDFIYDDKMIDTVDTFKHSKWLSFMEKRLLIAKKLLNETGSIVIHIDENEVHQLKLLCDEIFGDRNYIGEMIWKARNGKSGTNKLIAIEHEYILLYAKNIEKVNFYVNKNINSKKKMEQLRQWGQSVYREDRPTMFFPILYKNNVFSLIEEKELHKIYINGTFDDKFLKQLINEYKNKGYEVILPIINGKYGRWRKSYKGIEELIKESKLVLAESKGEKVVKKIIDEGNITYSAINSIIDGIGTASNGTMQIKEIFDGNKVFNTVKPLEIAKFLINLTVYNKPQGMIIDFFAGSGTTGQAVVEINKEDNGNRTFILCTNNENKICEEITYQRLKKINLGTSKLEAIKFNLKYYKTDYIDRFNNKDEKYYITNELSKYIQELVQLENGIDINDTTVQVLFIDEEIDEFSKNIELVKQCKILYVDTNALITEEQSKIFEENNIEILYIPEYYFEDEIMEVEQW